MSEVYTELPVTKWFYGVECIVIQLIIFFASLATSYGVWLINGSRWGYGSGVGTTFSFLWIIALLGMGFEMRISTFEKETNVYKTHVSWKFASIIVIILFTPAYLYFLYWMTSKPIAL